MYNSPQLFKSETVGKKLTEKPVHLYCNIFADSGAKGPGITPGATDYIPVAGANVSSFKYEINPPAMTAGLSSIIGQLGKTYIPAFPALLVTT